jgi:hypothetical protein
MKFAGLGGNGIIHLERSSAIATVGCRIRQTGAERSIVVSPLSGCRRL